MQRSEHVAVKIDLARVCRNAQEIARQTRVQVMAVVKADAYGLGAAEVVAALTPLVERFCFFSLREVVDARMADSGKAAMTLGPPDTSTEAAKLFLEHRAKPAVWTVEQARALAAAGPILAVDTGMQRFACPPEKLADVARQGQCDEAFTHATTLEAVLKFQSLIAGIPGMCRVHAAGTSLLHEPRAWLDGVRPGLALYRGAVRASTPLVDARASRGPVGYTGFSATHHGVIRAGYSNGLRPGPCLVNGQLRAIVEVGMQSSFVQLGKDDRAGQEVVLLGDDLPEDQVARAWMCSPQEALVRLTGSGQRCYAR